MRAPRNDVRRTAGARIAPRGCGSIAARRGKGPGADPSAGCGTDLPPGAAPGAGRPELLLLLVALAIGLSAWSADAQDDAAAPAEPAPDEALVLDQISVVSAETAGDGMASRTVVERGDLLGAFQGAGVPAILNTIPGVTTETTPGDPAIAVNIRGLQGKGRVVVTIDGARQNFAVSGHGPNGTFYTDPEMLRSVEVIRGPAGADAASGAIGGTLALRTVEAADLIAPGAEAGGEFRLRYGDLTEAPTVHLAYARAIGAAADVLLAFTREQASDYRAGDGTKVAAAETNLSGLAKASFAPTDSQLVTLSWSGLRSSFKTGVYSGIPRDNDMDTTNAVLDWEILGAGPFDIDATLYRTVTDVEQQLLDPDDRMRPIGPRRSYETTTDGLRATADTGFALGFTDHAVTFVADAFRDEVTTDDPTAEGGSLTPSGRRSITSFLVQDAIALSGSTQAILELRYDSYSLSSDDGSSSERNLAPGVTLRQQIGGALVLHATVAEAFRPPTLTESLVNGMHPEPADFYIRPNPSLKPERALSAEIGATLALADLIRPGDTLDATLTAYRNDVDDFIGLVERGTLFDSYLQYDNVDDVRIEGVELEIAYDAERAFGSISGQIIDGENRATGEPVSGIAPNRLVLTGGLRNRAGTLEVGARYTITGSREDGTLSSEAWQTVDLFLTQALGSRGTLGVALNNITDETYTQYLNTQPSPGFNALASLSIVF